MFGSSDKISENRCRILANNGKLAEPFFFGETDIYPAFGMEKVYRQNELRYENYKRIGENLRHASKTMADVNSIKEKEIDWAVAGGLASGLGGIGAGVAAALDAQAKNVEIRERNAKRDRNRIYFERASELSTEDFIGKFRRELQLSDEEMDCLYYRAINTTDALFQKLRFKETLVNKSYSDKVIGKAFPKDPSALVNQRWDIKIYTERNDGVRIDGYLALRMLNNKGGLLWEKMIPLPLLGVGGKDETANIRISVPNSVAKFEYTPIALWEITGQEADHASQTRRLDGLPEDCVSENYAAFWERAYNEHIELERRCESTSIGLYAGCIGVSLIVGMLAPNIFTNGNALNNAGLTSAFMVLFAFIGFAIAKIIEIWTRSSSKRVNTVSAEEREKKEIRIIRFLVILVAAAAITGIVVLTVGRMNEQRDERKAFNQGVSLIHSSIDDAEQYFSQLPGNWDDQIAQAYLNEADQLAEETDDKLAMLKKAYRYAQSDSELQIEAGEKSIKTAIALNLELEPKDLIERMLSKAQITEEQALQYAVEMLNYDSNSDSNHMYEDARNLIEKLSTTYEPAKDLYQQYGSVAIEYEEMVARFNERAYAECADWFSRHLDYRDSEKYYALAESAAFWLGTWEDKDGNILVIADPKPAYYGDEYPSWLDVKLEFVSADVFSQDFSDWILSANHYFHIAGSLNSDGTVEYELFCGESFTTCKFAKVNDEAVLEYIIAEKVKGVYNRTTAWESTFHKTKQG